MREYTTAVQSVGVDTLTCTAGEDGKLVELRKLGVELLMEDAGRGNRVQPFKRGPYLGGQTKSVGYAEWRDRGLVELRGVAAYDRWRDVLPLADKVSRIDVQVSVRQEPYDPHLAFRCWMGAEPTTPPEGKPPQYDIYARRRQGSTLYVGDRKSRFLARMYERWPKSKDDAEKDVWRYEVQCRRERAVQVAHELGGLDDVQPYLQGYVHQHFDRRGVPPIFDPADPVEVAALPRLLTDDERTLRWLAAAAAPAIRRLSALGKETDTLRVLGLEHLIPNTDDP